MQYANNLYVCMKDVLCLYLLEMCKVVNSVGVGIKLLLRFFASQCFPLFIFLMLVSRLFFFFGDGISTNYFSYIENVWFLVAKVGIIYVIFSTDSKFFQKRRYSHHYKVVQFSWKTWSLKKCIYVIINITNKADC